jgi:N6-adenosine-specific RNA methylase IME4
MVWVKPQMGIGNYWRVSHEFMLYGQRGNPKFRDHSTMSWQQADRQGHSSKPDLFRKLIEKASPGPYLEMFARNAPHGWSAWGNQIQGRAMYET